MAFELPKLPYAFEALEPVIDSKTMQIHHGKHHQAYTDKLNAAVKGTEWESKSIEDILGSLADLPENIRGVVRNNGGGYYNHSLFWESMTAPNAEAPQKALADKISADFGSFDAFKEKFAAAGANQFGSGWSWLYLTPEKKLQIAGTANQDTPFMAKEFGGFGKGNIPLLGLDVWEHAYYLNYQNRRPDYIAAWWGVVNWKKVSERFAAI